MNIEHLRSSFLGSPISSSCSQRRQNEDGFALRCAGTVASNYCLLSQSRRKHQGSTFSRTNFSCTSFLWSNLSSRSWSKTKCAREPFSRSKALIRPFEPLWNEGLLFIRCSVFSAVLSAAGLLLWYGHFKTKSFIENHLLPSVCSILSEYLQREITVNKVRGISPLGITLESCSIGTYNGEFSCGEFPTVKIRVRPFASVRRGKIVVDAVLSEPKVLVAQKEDFSWLGIPPASEQISRRPSSEEGIDFRTRSRRIAREKAASDLAKERAQLAKDFAKLGYVIPQRYSKPEISDGLKDAVHSSFKPFSRGSFFCVDDHLHWGDHHSMDMGIEYGLKHEELEKSFGVKKSSKSWLKFWRGTDSSFMRHKLKRETHQKVCDVLFSSKMRILKRSASGALAYFNEINELYSQDSSLIGPAEVQVETYDLKGEADRTNNSVIYNLNVNEGHENQLDPSRGDPIVKEPVEAFPNCVEGKETPNSAGRKDSLEGVTGERKDSGRVDVFGSVYLPFIMITKKLSRLCMPHDHSSFTNSIVTISKPMNGEASVSTIYQGDLKEVHEEGIDKSARRCKLIHGSSDDSVGDSFLGIQNFILHQTSSRELFPHWASNFKFKFHSFSRTIENFFINYFFGQLEKLRASMSSKVESTASEIPGVDEFCSESFERMLPVTLDSLYFSGGSLMLLGFGDQEPRYVKVLTVV